MYVCCVCVCFIKQITYIVNSLYSCVCYWFCLRYDVMMYCGGVRAPVKHYWTKRGQFQKSGTPTIEMFSYITPLLVLTAPAFPAFTKTINSVKSPLPHTPPFVAVLGRVCALSSSSIFTGTRTYAHAMRCCEIRDVKNREVLRARELHTVQYTHAHKYAHDGITYKPLGISIS